MINPPQFLTVEEMENSDWLQNVKSTMNLGNWPEECCRCQDTELVNKTSIRLNSIQFDKLQKNRDYLVIGGVLDNVCNSGCLTCDESHSTKIGSLKSKVYPIINNSSKFWQLPLDRIVHLDINGGEPSASKNYRHVLANLPSSVRSIRINTNCSIVIDEVETLVKKGIQVTVTVSLDGINEVHDYVRWPIKWDKFFKNLMHYKNIKNINLNTWTTVSALNIDNFVAIKQFAADHQLDHSYAFLHYPDPINVKYKNNKTLPYANIFPDIIAVDRNNQEELNEFILQQNTLRGLQ
jgi:sulfatase maturation enzyme AslB (radical SAM superfamily)